jgi:hypothetical protein
MTHSVVEQAPGFGALAAGVYPLTSLATPITVYLWGYQAELVALQSNQAPGEYVSYGVLAAPWHGAGNDGVKYFATTNGNSVTGTVVTEAPGTAIPPATLLGYLSEGQRTNVCLQSQALTTTPWAPTNVAGTALPTLTANSVVAPDGTLTATKMVMPAVLAGGGSLVYQTLTPGATNIFSMWARGNVGGERIYFSCLTGATYFSAVCNLTTQWQRFQCVVASGATLYYMIGADCRDAAQLPTPAQTVYLWGVQVEVGAFPSSYLPTTTAAVTRNADALSYPVAVVPAMPMSVAGDTVFAGVDLANGVPFSNGQNQYISNYPATQLRAVYGAAQPILVSGLPAVTVNTLYKQAMSQTTTRANGSSNGITGAGAVSAYVFGTLGSTFNVGNFGASGYPQYGTFRNVKLWNVALTDAQLQQVTTP